MADFDAGRIFWTLDADTGGLTAEAAEVNKFTREIGKSAEQLKRLQEAARMKELKRLEGDLKRGTITNTQYWKSLNKSERAALQFKQAVHAVGNEVKLGTITQAQAVNEVNRARRQFLGASTAVGTFRNSMREMSKSVQIALGPLSGVAARLSAFGGLMDLANFKLAALIGGFIGFGAILLKGTQAFKRFEDGLVGVAKTTDLEGAALRRFGEAIEDMAFPLATSTTELLGLAESAGQLGVSGAANILKFTEVMATLNKTTNITGQEGATQIARLFNVTATGVERVEDLANVLVALGNNTAATEGEINKIALRVAQATSQFQISAFQAEAFGAALAGTGQKAELSGSAFGRLFRALNTGVRSSNKELKQMIATLTGVSTTQIKAEFKADPGEFVKKFILGLGRVDSEVAGTDQILEAIGLKGEEVNQVFGSLATNTELLAEKFNIANAEMEGGTAAIDELSKRLTTLTSLQIQAGINMEGIGRRIGQDFSPATKGLVKTFNELTKATGTWAVAIEGLGIFVTVIGAIKLFGFVIKALGPSMITTNAISKIFAASIRSLGVAFRLAIGPVGWAILAAEALFFLATAFRDVDGASSQVEGSVESAKDAILALKNATEGQKEVARAAAVLSILDAEQQVFAARKRVKVIEEELAASMRGSGALTIINKRRLKEAKALAEEARKQVELSKKAFAAVNKLPGESGVKKDLQIDLPDTGEDKAAEKLRKIRESNEALIESVQAIRDETEATLAGKEALKEFNEARDEEKEILKFVNKLKKEPEEKETEFLKRRLQLEKEVTAAIRDRNEAQQVVEDSDILEDQENIINRLAEEITFIKQGSKVYKEFQKQRKMDDAILKMQKILIAQFGEESEIVKLMTEEYRKLWQEKLKAQETGKGVDEGLKRQAELAGEMGDAFGTAAGRIVNDITDIMGALRALEEQIIQSLINSLIAQPVANAVSAGLTAAFAGAAGAGATEAAAGAAAGAQQGGSFVVGGSGKTDGTLVQLKATRGEIVDVRTPGQQSQFNDRPGGLGSNVLNFSPTYIIPDSVGADDFRQTTKRTNQLAVRQLRFHGG